MNPTDSDRDVHAPNSHDSFAGRRAPSHRATRARRDLDRALDAAAALFREIHLGWEDRPLTPAPEWYDSAPLAHTLGPLGVGLVAAVEDFRTRVLPGALGAPDPRYVGLVNSSPLPAGPLADLLISALDNNCGAEHQGPSGAAAEREVLRVFGRLFMDRDNVSGLVLPGGSLANLHGILLARARAFPEWESGGPASVPGRPTLYLSDATHFSGARAGTAAGIGREGVRSVPTDGRGSIRVDELRRMIDDDRASGHLPFAVIATAGTTGTGAFDPVSEIADVAKAEDLWLHVDACYGGAARLLPELTPRFAGLERADSIAIDPHKWFFLPLTCSLVLTRGSTASLNPFDIENSYIPRGTDVYPYQRGILTSRRGMALALWMTLRAHGFDLIRDVVAENIRLTRRLEARLASAGFEVLPDGELSVACARWVPPELEPDEVDRLQGRIAERVLAADRAWFSTVRHAGHTWCRLNILNLDTSEAHVDDIADAMVEAARTPAVSRRSRSGRTR